VSTVTHGVQNSWVLLHRAVCLTTCTAGLTWALQGKVVFLVKQNSVMFCATWLAMLLLSRGKL